MITLRRGRRRGGRDRRRPRGVRPPPRHRRRSRSRCPGQLRPHLRGGLVVVGRGHRRHARQREAVRHHRRLQPQRLHRRAQELAQRHRRLRRLRHPVPVPARGRLPAREPGAGQLRLHPGHRRRHCVPLQPAHQRRPGHQPAPLRRERHQDLHPGHHPVERPGHPGRQPGPGHARPAHRAGRALRGLGVHSAVHQLDDQAARRPVERLLQPAAGRRRAGRRRSTRPSTG